MALLFSDRPGCQESHLKRLYRNRLLGREPTITQDMVNQAREQDLQEVEEFKNRFTRLMQEATELKPNTDSEVILKLKENLDRLYEQCAGLTGEQYKFKQAITKLTRIVMQAIWAGAGDDTTAHSELSQEEAARAQHYELLENPLVSHLLRPDSPIESNQLVAVILGEEVESAQQILTLFDQEHLAEMYQQADQLIQQYTGNIPGAPYAGSILGLLRESSGNVTKH